MSKWGSSRRCGTNRLLAEPTGYLYRVRCDACIEGFVCPHHVIAGFRQGQRPVDGNAGAGGRMHGQMGKWRWAGTARDGLLFCPPAYLLFSYAVISSSYRRVQPISSSPSNINVLRNGSTSNRCAVPSGSETVCASRSTESV